MEHQITIKTEARPQIEQNLEPRSRRGNEAEDPCAGKSASLPRRLRVPRSPLRSLCSLLLHSGLIRLKASIGSSFFITANCSAQRVRPPTPQNLLMPQRPPPATTPAD